MSNVTLKVTLNNGSLEVDQTGDPNHIPHEKSKITWHLHLPQGSDGSFNTVNDPNGPGFAWMGVPPPGIFGAPHVVVREKKITLVDDNTDPHGKSSVGDWVYQLCAGIDGKPYSTVYNPAAMK